MITYVAGDLFTSPAHVLVNTVNTIGVMGKGIAKDFKTIYPEMFQEYRALCERGDLTIGSLFLYRTPHKWVLNFPTKRHWRQRSQIGDIEAGLKSFVSSYDENRILSVAFPQLGCGNGQLDWEGEVRPLMEQYLNPLPIDVYIHIYQADASAPSRDTPKVHKRSWLQSEPAPLPAATVWDQLLHLITRDSMRTDWRVVPASDSDGEALEYSGQGNPDRLSREDFLNLWRQFRAFGLLAPQDMIMEFAPLSAPVMELLTALPFVEQTRFAPLSLSNKSPRKTTDELLAETAAQGVQLVPLLGGADPVSESGQPALLAG